MKIILGAIIVIIIFIGILVGANKRDTTLLESAKCVEKEAKAQGYAGNYNSVEAWDLFINKCTNHE